MKKKDIIETTDSLQSIREWYDENLKQLGNGLYAVVYQHPSNPKRAIKIGYCDDHPKQDGYLAYLKSIEKKGLKNNPWFPKVYFKQVYYHKSSNVYYYIVEMENLVGYRTGKISKKQKTVFLKKNNIDYPDDIQDMALDRKKVKDKKLANVVNILSSLYDNGHDHDLHYGNVMWRMKKNKTGNKIQLVVTDPVC